MKIAGRPSNFVVSILLIFFGSSTWLCINGIWMELSIYAMELPESWHLPNWLATFIEVFLPHSPSLIHYFIPIPPSISTDCFHFPIFVCIFVHQISIFCQFLVKCHPHFWHSFHLIFGHSPPFFLLAPNILAFRCPSFHSLDWAHFFDGFGQCPFKCCFFAIFGPISCQLFANLFHWNEFQCLHSQFPQIGPR